MLPRDTARGVTARVHVPDPSCAYAETVSKLNFNTVPAINGLSPKSVHQMPSCRRDSCPVVAGND